MDQQKIGGFLRQLRRERNLTQEQLAERMGVSNRSVSRWETGASLPDLSLLVELADFYQVPLGELLRGERCAPAAEETARQAADYSARQREILTRRLHWIFLLGVAAMIFYLAVSSTGLSGQKHWDAAADFALGLGTGDLVVGVLVTSPAFQKFRAIKLRIMGRLGGKR